MLQSHLNFHLTEAGCDEAGRGCLAGEVFAAAVILPKKFHHPMLNDSKQLTENQRDLLRIVIEKEAVDWAVGRVSAAEIDKINILKASILAMHRALDQLKIRPEFILVDGNKFFPYQKIQHQTVVKGDSKFASIAAASVLAKTHRDEEMRRLHSIFPEFGWAKNAGYGTLAHRDAIRKNGLTEHHRKTFRQLPEGEQLVFEF